MIECKSGLDQIMINKYHKHQAKSQLLLDEILALYQRVSAIAGHDIYGAVIAFKDMLWVEKQLNNLRQELKSTNMAFLALTKSLEKNKKTHYLETNERNNLNSKIAINIELMDKYLRIISGLMQNNILLIITKHTTQKIRFVVLQISLLIIESLGFLSSDGHQDYY
jgi:hypothetical protein